MRCWLACCLALLVSACGFHLRGIALIPEKINKLYLASSSPTSIANESLRRALTDSGVLLVNQPKNAKATLTIISRSSNQQLDSLSGASEAGRYRLTSYINFKVTLPDGKVLLKPTSVSASTLYSTNAMQILSRQSIKARLQSQLLEELNEAVINHLANLAP